MIHAPKILYSKQLITFTNLKNLGRHKFMKTLYIISWLRHVHTPQPVLLRVL